MIVKHGAASFSRGCHARMTQGRPPPMVKAGRRASATRLSRRRRWAPSLRSGPVLRDSPGPGLQEWSCPARQPRARASGVVLSCETARGPGFRSGLVLRDSPGPELREGSCPARQPGARASGVVLSCETARGPSFRSAPFPRYGAGFEREACKPLARRFASERDTRDSWRKSRPLSASALARSTWEADLPAGKVTCSSGLSRASATHRPRPTQPGPRGTTRWNKSARSR
jgi:hypothetical protein